MKTINLKNKFNGDKYFCEDMKQVEVIDDVEYLVVQKINSPRKFLMRKDSLEKDTTIKKDKVK